MEVKMIFEVKDGHFGYRHCRTMLRGISLTLSPGSVTCVLGPNGAGKTTLLKCMLGLLPWTAGETYIDGVALSQLNRQALWRRVGYVPQAKLSTFAYSVLDMVLLGRGAHLGTFARPGAADRSAALESLDIIGIAHMRDKLCSRISGGELQMVLIARALAARPELLVFDEPESNLDFKNQLIVMNTIRDLRDTHGISSLVNTHYPEHALCIADDGVILRGDGTASTGPAKALFTEQALERAFGVTVKMHDVPVGREHYTCVLPLAITQ
jgi:iron complex transport system ATP-binding protein